MEIMTGSYTGTGSGHNESIGFASGSTVPAFVIVYGDGNYPVVWRSDTMVAGDCLRFDDNSVQSGQITGFGADYFTVGTGVFVNANGVDYHFIAVADNGVGDFDTVTWAGNDVDGRAVSCGADPDFVLVQGESNEATWTTSANSADDSMFFDGTASAANRIQSLGTGQFTVGDDADVNASGDTYHAVVFAAVSGLFNVFDYTGNGADNQNMTDVAVDFTPDASLLQGGTERAVAKTNTMTGEDSKEFNVSLTSNLIQDHINGGVEVGTDSAVNTNGVDYYVAVWAEGVSSAGGIVNPVLPLGDRGIVMGGLTVR